jgi:hypothetical protein
MGPSCGASSKNSIKLVGITVKSNKGRKKGAK